MDLLSQMHLAGRSGRLRGTVEQLAQSARCPAAVLVEVLADLQATEAAAVTERNGIVTVINRRMYREYKEREHSKLRVRKFRCNGDVTVNVTPNVTRDSQRSESDPEGGKEPAPQNASHGNGKISFDPLPKGLFRREYEDMLKACDAEIERVKQKRSSWIDPQTMKDEAKSEWEAWAHRKREIRDMMEGVRR